MSTMSRSSLVFSTLALCAAALLLAALPLALSAGCGQETAAAKDEAADRRPSAPDLVAADAWLNTEKPISMADLKGQVVVLDFWTYCCINCIHIFPDLKFLEEKYKDKPFVVIGVHSGKFDQEKDAAHIRSAVLRHNIAHPVAVDSDYKVWKSYGVRAWPTLVVINTEGKVVQIYSGEGHRDDLDRDIADLLKEGERKGTLGKPLRFKTERQSFKSGVLEFPGKVLADADGKRLFIADTNHHRILLADFSGKVSHVVGSGQPGLSDGSFEQAQFNQPQGMALSEDRATLFVADTENHALRAVDLKNKTVTTLAGTGQQSHDRRPDGPGKTTPLSSPWDVARVGSRLFIASAGTHQIWQYGLDSGRVSLFAGTGRELSEDGPHLRAMFAQPSALATDGKTLYVADSETSSIRALDVDPEGQSRLLAGSADLFGFGLKDGAGDDALFQHPLGVALWGDTLFVADTFNGVIRAIDPKTREVKTWLGTGKRDPGDEANIGFYEPGGLSVAGDMLYVADTNHHRIVAVDIKTKKPRVLDVRIAPK